MKLDTNGHFEILELGAGDGAKTKVLLGHWLKKTSAFNYIPIDISQNVLDILSKSFKTELPKLNISPLQGDYFRALAQTKTSKNRRLVLFLGSNIGNFRKNNESIFIQAISEQLKPNDAVLIGFDLAKDPRVIRSAYNDKSGITKAFNLNLLQRCNRELNTNFAIEEFDHYPIYDPLTREARSYLVSNIAQKVSFPNSGKTIDIAKGEIIHTETSRKYTHEEINQLFTENGFNVERSFEDCKGYFADVLAVKK
ncbi:MAG: L-histidine N(alpha)-methyltransferase [Cryomorphaceae bacterium]|nr:L-histidine N(alpha)-methyltransferase [Cryomorphaceae bacterium]